MKQGKRYLNLVVWILLAAITAYFGYSIFSASQNGYTTLTVTNYEAGAGYYATGFLVRSETIIPSDSHTTVRQCPEGTHVSAGEVIATGYQSSDAISRQQRIEDLQAQLEQLQYAYGASFSVADQAALDEAIRLDLIQLSKYLHRGDSNSVEDLSGELKGNVIRRTGEYGSDSMLLARMDTIKAELATLTSQASDEDCAIQTPAAGYYSASVDGYEYVLTPDIFDTITVQQFNELAPDEVDANAAGKLISGNTWYYLCTVPSDELKDVAVGDTVSVNFARDFYETVTMRVQRVGKSEAGYKILVLSCSEFMQKITQLRKQSADLIFTDYTGLRVPKAAIHVEDGQTGVYVLENSLAKWKSIVILHDNGESYIVQEDKSSTDNLWVGDELLLDAKDLYDGKVVE